MSFNKFNRIILGISRFIPNRLLDGPNLDIRMPITVLVEYRLHELSRKNESFSRFAQASRNGPCIDK